MGGFNPPVPQQDSDWEIRVAVLLSLLLQILLIFVGPVRKRSSHPFPRFLVWSCYLLADWVADLALGLLLNNMGNIGENSSSSSSSSFNRRGGGGGATASSNSSGGGSPIIFAFWTPFLLLHLGGPDTITAYSLEDNELWLRHLIGLLFELFSALVIFGCSIRGNPMIPATVLMFVTGIIKYGERTFSLYSGSVDGFREKILDDPDPGPNYAKLMTEFDAKKEAGLVVKIDIANGMATKVQEEAERKNTEQLLLRSDKSVEVRAFEFFQTFRRLFVNLILSFKERRMSQAFFLDQSEDELQPSTAFEVIEVELNFIYDMVYTKAPVAHSRCGWLLRLFCSGCLLASLAIFFFLDKSRYGIIPSDVGITYALLLGGLALDATALLLLLFSDRATVELETSGWKVLRQLGRLTKKIKCLRTRRWSGKTSQLNLISYCLREPDRENMGMLTKCCLPLLMRFAGIRKQCKSETADDIVFTRHMPLIKDGDAKSSLLNFIFRGLKKAAKGPKEKREIMKLCDCRGSGVIERNKQDIIKKLEEDKAKEEDKGKDDINNQQTDIIRKVEANKEEDHGKDIIKSRFKVILLDSVTLKDFDESVLLWHIATDLCCFPNKPGATNKETTEKKQIAETLSEYMLYLLIKQPEMLSATAGIGLLRYRDTCAEANRFFLSMAAYIHGHGDARRLLLDVNTSKKPVEIKGDRSKSVLFDAVILAKLLRELDDEELMWNVITEVWQEMLTFAAGKCRGSEHVRQLSRGGELITLVWFLMAHMGLGNMYQIQAGDAKAKLIVIDQ
jgi:hypothetical protein